MVKSHMSKVRKARRIQKRARRVGPLGISAAEKELMNLAGLDGLPHVREWLGYTRAAVEVVNQIGADLDDAGKMNLLLQQNQLLSKVVNDNTIVVYTTDNGPNQWS